MQVYSTRPDYDPSFIINHFDWASLGRAQVVDIGGAHGHIAIQLASHFDNIDVMVQDMAQVVEGADEKVPDVLKGRVRFMAHDLFAPQSVQADVIFFRWILHNWSDEHCVRILRAQIPVLKPGVLILIQDTIMPEPGAVPLWKERCLRWVAL
jgi:trans-aconitate methyltransferase